MDIITIMVIIMEATANCIEMCLKRDYHNKLDSIQRIELFYFIKREGKRMLTIAVQKSGRLSEKTLTLLKECGISFDTVDKRKLYLYADNFPLKIIYLRDDDIPECVEDNIADIGVVGENVFAEKDKDIEIIERLGFSKCRLSIAVPKDMNYESYKDLDGLKIATTYSKIVQNFLDEKKISCEIHEINGSVEVAPSIGLSDVICDIVSSGSTLLSNSLKEVETIMRSEAVLVGQKNISGEKKELLEKLLFRIRSVKRAEKKKYILLNAPNDKLEEICKIFPGIKSPTIMPLAMSDWSSVHAVILEDEFWESIEDLKKLGAEGILVFPIEKMIL